MTTKKPLLGNKTVAEKMDGMNQEDQFVNQNELEEISHHGEVQKIDTSPLEEEKAMKKYRLVKMKKGVGADLDEDLHTEFKIMCIRQGKSQEEWIIESIKKAVNWKRK